MKGWLLATESVGSLLSSRIHVINTCLRTFLPTLSQLGGLLVTVSETLTPNWFLVYVWLTYRLASVLVYCQYCYTNLWLYLYVLVRISDYAGTVIHVTIIDDERESPMINFLVLTIGHRLFYHISHIVVGKEFLGHILTW